MRSLLVLSWVLALLCVTSAAHADGYYFTESLGGLHVGDELGARIPQSQAMLAVSIGFRADHLSYEIYGGGSLLGDPVDSTVDPVGLAVLGLDIKYSEPISQHLELYVKGGASHAWLTGGDLDGYGGRGLGAGAGVVLKGRGSVLGLLALPLFFTNIGPKMTGALYFEDGYDFYRFHRDDDHDPAIDAAITHWTFGIALGSDF